MGAEQVSRSRTLVGERNASSGRKGGKETIGDGEGSREGLREGVVWWVRKKGRARRALREGPDVQCETSRRKRRGASLTDA